MFVVASFQVPWGAFRPRVPAEGQTKPAARTAFEVGRRLLGVALLASGFWQMREGVARFANKYAAGEDGERDLVVSYWAWIGIASAPIVLGGGYFRLAKRGDEADDAPGGTTDGEASSGEGDGKDDKDKGGD